MSLAEIPLNFGVGITLHTYLVIAAALFAIGLVAVLARRNAILILVGIELMLSAANINFLAFWRFGSHPEEMVGVLFALFSIAVAAGEAAVGLALIILVYRHYKTINPAEFRSLHG